MVIPHWYSWYKSWNQCHRWQNADCLEPKWDRWCLKELKLSRKLNELTLVIPPDFLRLPVFSHFNFVMIWIFLLILEILLIEDRHRVSSTVGVVEDVLALRYELVPLELPQYCSSIIATTCEKCSYAIPPHTVYWLFMISQLRQFSHRFDFFFFKQTLHCRNIWPKGFAHWVIILEFLARVLIR